MSRSSFYYWRASAPAGAAPQTEDAALAVCIRQVHQDSDGTYGVPRITEELCDGSQTPVNHKRVARMMRSIGLGRPETATPARHHGPGPGRREGSGPGWPGEIVVLTHLILDPPTTTLDPKELYLATTTG
ncbi:IS3 family transposase [Streptomyces sp. NPDC056549]|uniref:IS3 family transposase n=1 Tax=Streptomyces sp. NPDC056549 TaxID=3345864 RepID=UPI003677CF52